MSGRMELVRMVAGALAVACFGAVHAVEASRSGKPAMMQHAHGKVGSGVVVEYAVPGRLVIGETVTLRLGFSGVSARGGATVEVRDSSNQETLASFALAQRERKKIDVQYTARVDGMQFIDVVTRQGGRTSVRSVPLRVGSGALTLKRAGKRQAVGGDEVISMPALEAPATR